MEEKRKSGRAIILKDGQVATMYREFDGRIFYTFPGGGVEGDETFEECAVREVFEEFGITVKPIEKLYEYETDKRVEHFYLCEWVSGEFGSGAGEEYEKNNSKGVYRPTLVKLEEVANIPLMPPEVAEKLHDDFVAGRFQ